MIWSIANKLRGTYQSDKYKEVIIPMTIIRRFSENAEAGDHYTGRDIIKLMVNILLSKAATIFSTTARSRPRISYRKRRRNTKSQILRPSPSSNCRQPTRFPWRRPKKNASPKSSQKSTPAQARTTTTTSTTL
ncbi:MAG: type I restriction-modification system subunit M N-terminal domain-containing protein [Megasphaera sp.]|uniref:type I restriction-modification system subunit M N-terminal domain-containing protein n=1 Tax=Megasphaera sp. TaxID=2023260 RepID=UPI003F03D7D8